MPSKNKIPLQEIVLVASTIVALLGQWFILDERVDILEQKLEYYKGEILDNSEYRENNSIIDAQQNIRIDHLEQK